MPPSVPISTPAPVTPLKTASIIASPVPEPSKASKKTPAAAAAAATATTGSEAKKNIKALAVESGLSKEITSQAKTPAKNKKTVLQDEDFPALESAKPASHTSTPVPAKALPVKTSVPAAKKTQVETPKPVAAAVAAESQQVETEPAPAVAAAAPKTKKAENKPMPVLNIAAATKLAAKSNPPSTVSSAVEKPDDAAFPALPTPSSVSVSSPATRTGPKTLRVISTPKTETPPAIPTAPPLRQAFSGLHRPETPGSENVSDSASIISASVSASRTNSPPPASRIGSAAVRSTTKSQQRKARKDATKKEAAAIAATAKPEPDIEIAPILGRKKKQKKEKPAPTKEAAAATIESRPVSPGPTEEKPAEKEKEKEAAKAAATLEKASTYRQAVNESISLMEPIVPRSRRNESTLSSQTESSRPAALDRPIPSPAAILQELVQSGLITDPEALAVLKAISSTSHRTDQLSPAVPRDGLPELKNIISKEDQEALLHGKPVRKIIDGSRVMLTPNGNCVRNLSPGEEERYLRLQANLAANFENAATYVHPRHETNHGFSVIKGRAVANGIPPYFPQGPPAESSAEDHDLLLPIADDPAQKMMREEKVANINQTVSTRVNLGTMHISTVEGTPTQDLGNAADTATGAASHNDTALRALEPYLAAAHHGHPLDSMTAGNVASSDSPFNGLAQSMPPPPLLPAVPATTATNAAAAMAGVKGAKGGALAGIAAMSLEDVEQAFALARKEAEKVEKSLNQVIKKNRRLLSLSSSGGGGH